MPTLFHFKFPRKIQFGLRTFLIGVTLVAIALTASVSTLGPWLADRGKIETVKQVNAQVFTEPRGNFLLRQFIGDTISERSIYLHLDDPRVDDDWIKKLGPMPHIEVLTIRSPKLSDEGLRELVNWPKLQSLHLVGTQVSDSAIESLREVHPSLQLVDSRQSVP